VYCSDFPQVIPETFSEKIFSLFDFLCEKYLVITVGKRASARRFYIIWRD
jgi:hypothetical protein